MQFAPIPPIQALYATCPQPPLALTGMIDYLRDPNSLAGSPVEPMLAGSQFYRQPGL